MIDRNRRGDWMPDARHLQHLSELDPVDLCLRLAADNALAAMRLLLAALERRPALKPALELEPDRLAAAARAIRAEIAEGE